MSFDLVMRTLGVVACLYTVAYFVTSMSVAALNAVTFNSGPMCGETGCVTVAQHRPRLMPGPGPRRRALVGRRVVPAERLRPASPIRPNYVGSDALRRPTASAT